MSLSIEDSTIDIVVNHYNDKGTPNVETITIPATASATQADYVVLTNSAGLKVACWLDINAAGTAPTGAAYVAATVKLKISIVTGGTSAANATIFATALDAIAWSNPVKITDNGNGTVTISQLIGASVAAAVPKNANDSGAGSITATTNTTGAAKLLKLSEYFPKGVLHVLQNVRDNAVIFNIDGPYIGLKGQQTKQILFKDVTSPSTANLTALVAQIITWKNA